MAVRLPALLTRAPNTTETRRKDPRSHLRAAMRLPLQHNGATGVEEQPHSFSTSALSSSGHPRTPSALPPRKVPSVLKEQQAG